LSKKNEKEEESLPVCKVGKIVVEDREVPVILCLEGDKVDLKIPDRRLLRVFFKEKGGEKRE
jgi:hypothetical protein